MFTQRVIDLKRDREVLLDLHVQARYEDDSPWAREVSLSRYRRNWLSTAEAQQFLDSVVSAMEDGSTIAEIWEEDGVTAGYLLASFTGEPEQGFSMYEIRDLAVAPQFQGRDLVGKMLERVEALAREAGVSVIRVGVGIENRSTQKLLADALFQVYRVEFEKVLKRPG